MLSKDDFKEIVEILNNSYVNNLKENEGSKEFHYEPEYSSYFIAYKMINTPDISSSMFIYLHETEDGLYDRLMIESGPYSLTKEGLTVVATQNETGSKIRLVNTHAGVENEFVARCILDCDDSLKEIIGNYINELGELTIKLKKYRKSS